MRTRLGTVAAAILVLASMSTDALAQRWEYGERSYQDRFRRNYQAGVFDYYALSLSWSPTYCADRRNDNRYEAQCDRNSGRPYAFVLHGLWPQFNRGWPQYCRSPDRGYVPRPVARRMLDIMPAERLIFNEYRKHGTCTGLGVDGYFDLARRLYEKVRIPDRYVGLTDDRLQISPSEVISDFVAANQGLTPDMVAVVCRGSGNRLREVRICFDRGGAFRTCGRNEDQRHLCSADRVYVPPVRMSPGRQGPESRRDGQGRNLDEIVPGPRDERRL